MDAVRGVACVVMIVWHTADAWLLGEIHGTPAFERARLVGGFAAPFFLWLAGLSIALSTELRPTWARTQQALVRAGWVVVVGYGLKLLAWTVDHGAIRELRCLPTLALAIPAMAALVYAFREPALGSARTRGIAAVIGALVLVGTYAHVDGLPRSPDVLARLDVLQGIGAALASMTLLLFVVGRLVPDERSRAVVLGLAAIAVALATPHWIGVSLDPMPTRLADYVARTVAAPGPSGARFPLFPWLGHALYGAVIGTLLRAAPRDLGAFDVPFVRRPWLLVIACLAVLVLVFEAGPVAPSITARAEWMRPVLRLAFYGTAAIGTAGVLTYVGRWARPLYDAIATMGRSSLLVYGAHLEVAYGLLGVPLRQSLGWAGWALGALLLAAAMVATARLAEAREARARGKVS